MNQNFLHVHSMYSFNDSTQSPDEIVKRVKEIGGTSVTLTDHGTLLGIEPFMDAGKKYGINTIPGVETYIENREHLILFAKNYKGYQSISHAMREANKNIQKSKNGKISYPIMTPEIIEEYFKGNDNVVATSACIKGPIADILLTNYRIKENNKKLYQRLEENIDAYDMVVKYEKEKAELDTEIQRIKNDKKEKHKYTTKTYLNKIEGIRKKIERYPNKAEEYKHQLDEALRNNEEGIASDNRCDNLISQKKERLESVKQTIKKYKTGSNKYIKAKKELDQIKLLDEDSLYRKAKKTLKWYKSVFPNFYIELQYHFLDMEAYVMPLLAKLAKETNTPVIAANDAHMTDNSQESIEARRIVRFNYFSKSQEVSDADRELYLKNNAELHSALINVLDEDDVKEAINNTSVLDECKVIMPEEKHYPSVKTEYSFDELLDQAREERIKEGTWNDTYEKRLIHEREVIKSMGYVDYHMIVRDFCNVARLLGKLPRNMVSNIDFTQLEKIVKDNNYNSGVGVGPGRGSAAGSLVCNMLGITNIDPIKYNLLFERFLNPERVSMPDIDSDISTSIRPTVIKYLKWKYGEKAVCSIATELTYGAKNAIKMAGRERAYQLYQQEPVRTVREQNIKDYSNKYTKVICDIVPEEVGVTLSDCQKDAEILISKDAEFGIIWDRAKLLEGKVNGTSVHAGGVIISDNDDVNDYIPLAWNEEKEVWAAQCNMIKAEEKGLLKMDLLGLRTLDCISDCMELVLKNRGISIDSDHLPFESEVFSEIYSKGNTNSVFQFESEGMKSMLKEFKPTSFEDLILLVAAYRPGPMQYLEDIIKIKKGEKQIEYKTPMLESILSPTYGAVIYQEQVMQIFQKLAGYSLGGADLVRRAMSKKKEEKLAHEKDAFVYGDPERGITGCVANGISKEIALDLFNEVMDFAKYAFNKSHAAAYAVVSYQTAYLKYHYPVEYMCAMFNNEDQKSYKPLFSDCEYMNINILPPDINYSYFLFTVEDGSIRYGFSGIKGIGEKNEELFENVINERKGKIYKSINDFLARNLMQKNQNGEITYSLFPKKQYEVLAQVGAFDKLGYKRENIETVPKIEANTLEGMKWKIADIHFDDGIPNEKYNIEKELELLGAIVSVNKLQQYSGDEHYGCIPLDNLQDGNVTVFGYIVSATQKVSRNGNQMLEIILHGKRGECKCFAMGRILSRTNIDEIQNEVYRIKGRCKGRGIFIESMTPLPPGTECYSLLVDTEEKYNLVSSVYSPEDKEGIEVHISSFYGNKNGKVERKTRALLQTLLLPKKKFDYLAKKGLTFTKWDGTIA